MEYFLWLEFNLNNNGFEMQTYWLDIAIPAQTIYLVIAVVVALRIRKRLGEVKNDNRTTTIHS
jgi:hypothetical protein